MINLTNIFKNIKPGTKFYSPLVGDVYYDKTVCDIIIFYDSKNIKISINAFGQYFCHDTYPDAECMVFPSKENRDWTKYHINIEVVGWNEENRFIKGIYLTDNKLKYDELILEFDNIVPIQFFNINDLEETKKHCIS